MHPTQQEALDRTERFLACPFSLADSRINASFWDRGSGVAMFDTEKIRRCVRWQTNLVSKTTLFLQLKREQTP